MHIISAEDAKAIFSRHPEMEEVANNFADLYILKSYDFLVETPDNE